MMRHRFGQLAECSEEPIAQPPVSADLATLDALRGLRLRDEVRTASAPNPQSRRTIGMVAIAVAVTSVGLLAFGARGPGSVTSKAVAASPPASLASASFEAAGFVVAQRQATVAAEVTGRVVALPVAEGQTVRRGAVLAMLDASAARTDLSTAMAQEGASQAAADAIAAQLNDARKAHERSQALLKQGFVTDSRASSDEAQMMSLQANLARAGAELTAQRLRIQRAREELAKFTIVAPFDGVVIGRNAQVGEMISPISAGGGFTRTGICTIVDMGSLEIVVDVSEQNIAQVMVGDKAVASVDAYRNVKMPARITAIIPAANREKGTVTVRLALIKPDKRIFPNMSAQVSFISH